MKISNIKKAFALLLILCLAAGFSLQAAAASFTYKDAELITNPEDFNLLYNLNILRGDNNNRARPTDSLTRAEAVKLIYVCLSGGADDSGKMYSGYDLFADVADGHWAKGYINYCYLNGILSGTRSSGGQLYFSPEEPLTDAQLIKLLAGMLGYDTAALVGSDWLSGLRGVALEARLIGSGDELKDAPLSRSEAAKYLARSLACRDVSAPGAAFPEDRSFGESKFGLYVIRGLYPKSENQGPVLQRPLNRSIILAEKANSEEPYRVEIFTAFDSSLLDRHLTVFMRSLSFDSSGVDEGGLPAMICVGAVETP